MYSRVSRTYNGTVTLTNISSGPINGPLEVVFTGMPASITLVNASGTLGGVSAGAPYLTVPTASLTPGGTPYLASGQTVTMPVQFSNPSNLEFNATLVVYSGPIP